MKHEKLFERNGLFDASVPRYTSYPPANRFEPIKDHSAETTWLASLDAARPVSVYAHIPFCQRLCWFCACRTQGTKSKRSLNTYIDRVLCELALKTQLIDKKLGLERLHLGGGTPTILPPELMSRFLDAIFQSFDASAMAEFSVEIDPTDVDEKRINSLKAFGMTRASIGVQDFDADVQAAIGRLQSFAQTRKVYDQLREVGIANINLDLLYGLPFQSRASLDRTLDQVLKLAPDRIAAFGYAHVPWMSRRQKLIKQDSLPGPKARLGLFRLIQNRLKDAGYVQIGIDHFVRPADGLARAKAAGRLHRNFQGYTDDTCTTLLGFGASAISKYGGGFRQNAAFVPAYSEALAAARLPSARGINLGARDKLLGECVEALMCYGQIDANALGIDNELDQRFVLNALQATSKAFSELVQFKQECLTIDPAYTEMTRLIAAHFEGHRQSAETNSVAI